MCLIAFVWRSHRHYPLVLIANRDESHSRPSAAADVDPDAPGHKFTGAEPRKTSNRSTEFQPEESELEFR